MIDVALGLQEEVTSMKWSLQELEKYREAPLKLQEMFDLTAVLKARDQTISDVSPVKVQGLITLDQALIIAHLDVQVTLTLPSTRSLVPVALPLSFSIDEIYTRQLTDLDEQKTAETMIYLEQDVLDLDQVLTDNILLQIPSKILTPAEAANEQEMPHGNDWQVISEADYQAQQAAKANQVDPRFAKLKGLLKSDDDQD